MKYNKIYCYEEYGVRTDDNMVSNCPTGRGTWSADKIEDAVEYSRVPCKEEIESMVNEKAKLMMMQAYDDIWLQCKKYNVLGDRELDMIEGMVRKWNTN